MSKTETGGPAFPVVQDAGMDDPAMNGMTLRQYAAIKLKVPDSGTDWLDDMIRASLRDAAIDAIRATLAAPAVADGALVGGGDKPAAYVRLSALAELQDKRVASTGAALHKVQGAGMVPLYAAPQLAIPAGWALVPVEPAPEMADAYGKVLAIGSELDGSMVWRAMLAAAPKSVQTEPLTDQHVDDIGFLHGIPPSKRSDFARAIERAHGIGGVKS